MIQRRYWDSAAFIAWLTPEDYNGRLERCRAVVKKAEAGQLVIVTSSVTLVEVIRLKGHKAIPQEKEETIRQFFMHEYIVVRQLDRRLAEISRSLIWQHNLTAKDAVHVATALHSRVDQLDTFDEGLWSKSGALGDPPLLIGPPNLSEQLEFPALSDDNDDLGDDV